VAGGLTRDTALVMKRTFAETPKHSFFLQEEKFALPTIASLVFRNLIAGEDGWRIRRSRCESAAMAALPKVAVGPLCHSSRSLERSVSVSVDRSWRRAANDIDIYKPRCGGAGFMNFNIEVFL
jgi:hypothetical protein